MLCEFVSRLKGSLSAINGAPADFNIEKFKTLTIASPNLIGDLPKFHGINWLDSLVAEHSLSHN
jgi:hypothetical protein